jgi:hypothetical protein
MALIPVSWAGRTASRDGISSAGLAKSIRMNNNRRKKGISF